MSERGEIEVLMPLNHLPDAEESKQLARDALVEAKKLIKKKGGRILGLSRIIRAEDPVTSQPALKVRFAVQSPEKNFARSKDE